MKTARRNDDDKKTKKKKKQKQKQVTTSTTDCTNTTMATVTAAAEGTATVTDKAVAHTYIIEGSDKEVQVLKDGIYICSQSQPQKNITLSFSAWAKLMSKLNEIDVEVRELNRQTRRVAYKLQLQKHVYLSVTDGYECVDIRSFYIPYGLEDTPRTCTILC